MTPPNKALLEAAGTDIQPTANPALWYSRRRLLKAGIGVGAAATAMYIAPSLVSVRPRRLYAHSAFPGEPPVDTTKHCVDTVLTFFHGHHNVAANDGQLVGVSYLGEGVKFVNWNFHDSTPEPGLGFSDAHGVVTEAETCGTATTGVMLFPNGIDYAELYLRIGVSPTGPAVITVYTFPDYDTLDECLLDKDPFDDANGGVQEGFDPEDEPVVKDLFLTLANSDCSQDPNVDGVIKAIAIEVAGTPLWGMDTLAFGKD